MGKKVNKRTRAFGLEAAALSIRKARTIVVDGKILHKNETAQIAGWLVNRATQLRRQAELEKVRQEKSATVEVVEAEVAKDTEGDEAEQSKSGALSNL